MKTESDNLNDLLEEYFEERLRLLPLEATAIGDHRYDHLFPNYIGEEHREAFRQVCEKYLEELCQIQASSRFFFITMSVMSSSCG